MKQKIENDAAALMRSVVSRRGRNVELAESAVRESKSFTDQEALAQHLIDYVALQPGRSFPPDRQQKLQALQWPGGPLKLAGQPIVAFGMTLKEQILDYLMDPNISFILLAIGAVALYAEFNHPGAVDSRHRRRCLYLDRTLCLESAAHALCRAGTHSRRVRTFRGGSQIRQLTACSPSAASLSSLSEACFSSIRPSRKCAYTYSLPSRSAFLSA